MTRYCILEFQMAAITSGNAQRLCDPNTFSSLPSNLSLMFEPLRRQLCDVDFMTLRDELSDTRGYNEVIFMVRHLISPINFKITMNVVWHNF